MAITQKEWARMRKMMREEIESLLNDFEATQTGGYDGATPVVDDEWADEGSKRRAKRIGFRQPASATRQAKLRKRLHGDSVQVPGR